MKKIFSVKGVFLLLCLIFVLTSTILAQTSTTTIIIIDDPPGPPPPPGDPLLRVIGDPILPIGLEWDADSEADLCSYVIYFDTSSSNYNHHIDVGYQNEYTIREEDLNNFGIFVGPDGLWLHFALTKVDCMGQESNFIDNISVFVYPSPCIQIEPKTWNLNSCGKWINVSIELPKQFDPSEIDISTVSLYHFSPVLDPKYGFVTDEESYLLDETCEEGVVERMVRFDRQEIISSISFPVGVRSIEAKVPIHGKLYDGSTFGGFDVIRLIEEGKCPGDFDCDKDVDGTDAATIKKDFGRSKFRNPCSNEVSCNGDFDSDDDVDGNDAHVFKSNFGRSPINDPCPSNQ